MIVAINPNQKELLELLKRKVRNSSDLQNVVASILRDVQLNGDKAVLRYGKHFDRVEIKELIVEDSVIKNAEKQLTDDLKLAIQKAAANIRKFHEAQIEEFPVIETAPGVKCWRKSLPIEKVGLYIPGGTAPLFSTVLMLGIPANIAGCKEIVLCSPPNEDGEINPAILYAAKLTGVTKVIKSGGIQAIGAMTFGTDSVPKVHKIFGPGNQFVTAAKLAVQSYGIAIDMPAGPSEVMVVADETSNVKFIVSDLLAQAEHGVDSQVILLTSDEAIVKEVKNEIKIQLAFLERSEIIQKVLDNSSIIVVNSNQIADVINEYAPEHLILNTKDNDSLIPQIMNAGSVFIGPYTPESAGDYASGTNHTLPTNGFARQYSGVSLDSFVKKITFQEISEVGMMNLGKTIELMAEAEGLQAHKNAVTIRLKELRNEN